MKREKKRSLVALARKTVFIIAMFQAVAYFYALAQQPSVLPRPLPAPKFWTVLIGEYASPTDTLYIAEDNAQLLLVTKKPQRFPLNLISGLTYSFPGGKMFHDSVVVFKRSTSGSVSEFQIGSTSFKRLMLGGEHESSFSITPLKPIAELRKIALASIPPVEKGSFLPVDLVELSSLDPEIKYDIRYATTNNFLGEPVYSQAKAFLQRPAAMGLLNAQRWLKERGYGLLIHDAYRPWYVTKIFWDATPEDKKIFVADPTKGSRHNRGCAVDCSLYDLKTGKPLEMTGGYDEMSERSYPAFPGGTSLQRWHRDLLRSAMESNGFAVYEWEWWHFDYKDWKKYPIGTKTFEEISR